MDEITAMIGVKLSFIVSVSAGPKSPLTGDKLNEALLRHVESLIEAKGGLDIDDLDAHTILEIRDTNTDQVLVSA